MSTTTISIMRACDSHVNPLWTVHSNSIEQNKELPSLHGWCYYTACNVEIGTVSLLQLVQ